MGSAEKAIILINVGTPDSPDVKSVRRFLFQFLNDRRVIDLPSLLQKLLVNVIIVPFRAKNSTRLYKQLWTSEGSPILLHLKSLSIKLQAVLGSQYRVFPAMRYGNPSLKNALKEIQLKNFKEVVVFPLFPQYASSTTGSVVEYVMSRLRKWTVVPEVHFVGQFYDQPAFLRAFAKRILAYHPYDFDHIIFSYHGLPLQYIDRVHPEVPNARCNCSEKMPLYGSYCYKATCYQTTRLLAHQVGLSSDQYSIAFQSRLSKNWLTPFTDETIIALAKKGAKKLLVVAPSFVADCLETTVELGINYSRLFKQNDGQELVLVESLNDDSLWVLAVAEMVK